MLPKQSNRKASKKIHLVRAVLSTLFSPVLALPYVYAITAWDAFQYPPGTAIYGPNPPTMYILQWSIRSAIVTELLIFVPAGLLGMGAAFVLNSLIGNISLLLRMLVTGLVYTVVMYLVLASNPEIGFYT